MILTSDQVRIALDSQRLTKDVAQTIASWWHGGTDVEITKFSHGLFSKVDYAAMIVEVDGLLKDRSTMEDRDVRELKALLVWIRRELTY